MNEFKSPAGEHSMPVAPWLDGRGRSVLREMVGLVSKPGVISLARRLAGSGHVPGR